MAYNPTLEQYNADLALETGDYAHPPLTQEQFNQLKQLPDGIPYPMNLVGTLSANGLGDFRKKADADYAALQASRMANESTGFGGMLSTLAGNPVAQGIMMAAGADFLTPLFTGASGIDAGITGMNAGGAMASDAAASDAAFQAGGYPALFDGAVGTPSAGSGFSLSSLFNNPYISGAGKALSAGSSISNLINSSGGSSGGGSGGGGSGGSGGSGSMGINTLLQSLGGLAGGYIGGSQAPQINAYNPTGLSSVDSQLQQLLGQNTNTLSGANNPYTVMNPQLQQVFQQLFNTPGQAGYQQAAGNAGQAYTGVGTQGLNLSSLLAGASPLALAGGANVMNMGMDPQNALYNRMFQQTNDQANVSNAQYGLTGQQAAGNVQQADSNFNIDWQNNELQRAIAGLSGYDTAAKTASGTATAAQNIGQGGAANILEGGAAPYATGQNIGGNQSAALQSFIQSLLGPATSRSGQIGQLGGYLGQGVGQNSNAINAFNAQMAGGQSGSNMGSGVGSLLGSLFNPATISSGSSLLSDLFGSSGASSNINGAGLDFLSSYGF
jgi:hypothetical protein